MREMRKAHIKCLYNDDFVDSFLMCLLFDRRNYVAKCVAKCYNSSDHGHK